jgi:succinoglycan biosynthesis transport protein ExoP
MVTGSGGLDEQPRMTQGAQEADIPQVLGFIARRWRWIVIPSLVAFILAAVSVTLLRPRYTAEAKILLESRDNYFTRVTGDAGGTPPNFDSEAVQSQVQLIMSRDLAREAIRQLGLVGNPEFDSGAESMGLVRRLLVLAGLSKAPAERAPEDRVLANWYDQMIAFPVSRSRVVTIEFQSRDPELAAKAANIIADLYLEMLATAKTDTARNASQWLATTIDPLRLRLSEAEAKVEAFRSGSGLILGGSNTTLVSQQLSELSGQLAAARNARADAEAKARLIRDMLRGGRTLDIPDVANNELVRRLTEQRVSLRAQIALESRTLLANHPRIKELNAQIADLDIQIRLAAERTVRTLENEARLAASRVEGLEAAIETQKRQVAQANESEVTLRALERDARTLREQLESYLAKYREAIARNAENAAVADARIVSRAIVPMQASFPKKTPIVVLSTVATAVLAVGAIIARELLGGGGFAPARPMQVAVAARGRREDETSPAETVRSESVSGPAVALHPAPVAHAGLSGHDVAVRASGGETAFAAAAMPALRGAFDDAAAMGAPSDNGPVPLVLDLDAAVLVSPDVLERALGPVPEGRRGRRVAIVFSEGFRSGAGVRALAAAVAGRARGVYIQMPPAHHNPFSGPFGPKGGVDAIGLTDLVAGEATFVEVIDRCPGTTLHHIGAGLGPVDDLTEDPDSLNVALTAIETTYDSVAHGIPRDSAEALLPLIAARVDCVIHVVPQDGEDSGEPRPDPVIAGAARRVIQAQVSGGQARLRGAAA